MGMANTLAQMEFALGISIENDIIPCLGENYGVVFAKFDDIDVPVNPETTASGAAPAEKKSVPIIFPQLYAFCELKNSAKLQEVLIGATQRFVDQANKDRQELEAKIRAAQAANAKDKQPLPEPAKDDKKYMELKSRDYRGAKVYTVEVPDFPVGQLRFNYAFVDKYIIVSFSPEATEKAIDVISGKSDNLSGSVGFAAAKNKIPQSYSDLGFFDFRRLLNNIRSTKFFKELREKLPDKGAQAFSQADLDSVLDLLSNINSLTMTRRKADAETVESICYFDVKGL
jgi:hypothetical protein